MPAAPTTRPAPTIDLSLPIPGGSLHGTPRPPLENTGDDYIAITKSLIANFRWLTENPNAPMVSEVWTPGTELHDSRVLSSQHLLDKGYRWADDGYHVRAVELVDSRSDIASMRVFDAMQVERLIDSAGAEVAARERVPQEKTWNVLLALGADRRWRIADWSLADIGAVDL